MSEIDDKILDFVKSEKAMTKIKNVGGEFYRVNVYTKFTPPDSVITRTRMHNSYYLRIDKNNQIHDLTRGRV
jgi:hypothetical protein